MPMPPSNHESRLLRFGVFEVDLDAGELRKNGARIRLQEQPFVDFDHSVNTAVNKIRDSLGDSASSPRFVETLARRGYRFIAPVDGTTAAAVTPAAENVLHPELQVPVPRRGLVRALFALIQVMYLIFYVSGLAHLHAAERVAGRFLPGWGALCIAGAVLVTGATGIPLRFYLISAVAFDFRKLDGTFNRLFPFVLALDQLWAIAPFLLLPQIGVGLTFAATAALLYVPFSERTLVRMAYSFAQNSRGG